MLTGIEGTPPTKLRLFQIQMAGQAHRPGPPSFLRSAADAVITKTSAPILVLGPLGGAVIGWLVPRFGR